MRKPVPLDAKDACTLAAWLVEMRELATALHDTAMDATARERIHSRKELRKRLSKHIKRLHGLIDTVQPILLGPFPAAAANDPDASRVTTVT